ncbi:unnamed protein product [Paramecium octaurelia]|uniref:Uncharacterized protein n=1 Tax=Paramecium octaurelia TaxID=43137 RepID=A0A8S1YC46_PAROT|nr:unnamed protein product [Paramecium octaurelia]
MQTNQNTSTNLLLQNKKELFHIQLRKEKREEIFKSKRIIQKQNETPEHIQLNPEQLDQYITELMKECIDIYRNRLPDDFDKMLNNLKRLRKLQNLDQRGEAFSLSLFKNDFIEYILVLLNEQFDHASQLQVEGATILANFFGMMDKNSRLYFSSYLPMLNVLSDVITKNFGRLLISKNASLVDSCLYALGNAFYDQQILVQKFKQHFGLKHLLQVSMHLNTVVWVLDTLTGNREFLNKEELELSLQILDKQLQSNDVENFIHSLSALRNISQYQIDAIPMIIGLTSFSKIVEIVSQKQDLVHLHSTSLEIIFALSTMNDYEQVKRLDNKYNLMEVYVTYLSSYEKEYRLKSMISLTNLCNLNEIFAIQLSKMPYVIEKIISITIQTEQQQILNGVNLIYSMLQYEKIEMNQNFINNKILSLISRILEYLNNDILISTLKSLWILLQSIEYYTASLQIPGDDKIKSQVYMMNQLNVHNIQDKLLTLYQNVNNQEVRDWIDECVNILEKTQNEIENY